MLKPVFFTGTLCVMFIVHGAVRADDPAFLGVKLGPVPEALSAHLKGAEGAIVESVVPGSPAEKAGLQRFDVIVSLNGSAVNSPDAVRGRILEAKPGTAVKVGVVRGSETINLEATLGAQPAELPEMKPEAPVEKKPAKEHGFLGIGPMELPPVLAYHLGLKAGSGVVVGDVYKGSPAEKAGIESQDVIVAVDGRPVESTADFLHRISEKAAGDQMKVDFIHKGEKKTVQVTLDPRPKGLPLGGFSSSRLQGAPGMPDPFAPRSSRRGRIILRNPDGSEHTFQIPDSIWKAEDLFKDLERKFDDLKGQIPEFKDHLQKSLKELEGKLKDESAPSGWSSSSDSYSSVIRSVEGEWDVTVRDQNGVRTVTVLQGGKSVASDLPYDKLDTLPAGARDQVKKVVESIKIGPPGKGKIPIDAENKIRA